MTPPRVPPSGHYTYSPPPSLYPLLPHRRPESALPLVPSSSIVYIAARTSIRLVCSTAGLHTGSRQGEELGLYKE